MESFQAFMQMGGYGGFVWPAYGISVVAMLALLVASVRGAKAREAELDALNQARGRRRNANRETEA